MDHQGQPGTAQTLAADAHDVRMRGFSRRAEVADVWRWIAEHATPLSAEKVAIDEASGRVLAHDIVATLDVPAFDRAAMDGYALHAEETTGAGDYNPLLFRVIGRALPGQPFGAAVQAGEAVRIMSRCSHRSLRVRPSCACSRSSSVRRLGSARALNSRSVSSRRSAMDGYMQVICCLNDR